MPRKNGVLLSCSFQFAEKANNPLKNKPDRAHTNTISMLCKHHHVERLYLFGSALSSNFSENSDIDLLVQFGNVNLSKLYGFERKIGGIAWVAQLI